MNLKLLLLEYFPLVWQMGKRLGQQGIQCLNVCKRLDREKLPYDSLVKAMRIQVYTVHPRGVWYGPKTRTTANVEKARPKRKRLQVRMVAFEWKGAIQTCRRTNVERFIGNERG